MTRRTTSRRRRIAGAGKALAFTIVASAMVLPWASARAESGDRIGDAVAIVNTVFADFEKTQRTLATGDDVRQNEVIEVTPDSRGELKLDDDTKLALGPGSRLVLDKFVYDSDKKAGSIVLDLAKGAFRFITGVAAKPTYIINTPNASITVRGTIFDVFILPDDTVWLLLHEGGLEVTGRKSACRVLDQPGRLIRISNDGRVGSPVDWSKLPGNDAAGFDAAFPFVDKPPQIDPAPVLTRAAILASALPDAPDKACLNAKQPIKIQRADRGPDGGDKPKKSGKSAQRSGGDKLPIVTTKIKIKKVRVKDDEDKPKRTKTTKRPRNSDDDAAASAAAAAIIIGIGVGGGFGRKHRGGGHDGPQRGMGPRSR